MSSLRPANRPRRLVVARTPRWCMCRYISRREQAVVAGALSESNHRQIGPSTEIQGRSGHQLLQYEPAADETTRVAQSLATEAETNISFIDRTTKARTRWQQQQRQRQRRRQQQQQESVSFSETPCMFVVYFVLGTNGVDAHQVRRGKKQNNGASGGSSRSGWNRILAS